MSGQNVYYRYSESFKQKIISDIERGKYTIRESSDIYGITCTSIRQWLKKLGKNNLVGKVVQVKLKDEADRIKQLKKEKQELEHALAQAHLKILVLESTIESAGDRLKIDIKKNFGMKASKEVLSK